MMLVVKPSTAATRLPTPIGYNSSMTRQTATEAQPMKTAEEYRFVTKTIGRSMRYMRESSVKVWTRNQTTSHQKVARRKKLPTGTLKRRAIQPATQPIAATMYMIRHW